MKLDAQQAVEVLKNIVRDAVAGRAFSLVDIQPALAALDGKHVYASRFAVGDECWVVAKNYYGEHSVMPVPFPGVYQFLSKEEAEAEAAKRNKERER